MRGETLGNHVYSMNYEHNHTKDLHILTCTRLLLCLYYVKRHDRLGFYHCQIRNAVVLIPWQDVRGHAALWFTAGGGHGSISVCPNVYVPLYHTFFSTALRKMWSSNYSLLFNTFIFCRVTEQETGTNIWEHIIIIPEFCTIAVLSAQHNTELWTPSREDGR